MGSLRETRWHIYTTCGVGLYRPSCVVGEGSYSADRYCTVAWTQGRHMHGHGWGQGEGGGPGSACTLPPI
jgi:hypothetical protein